MYSGIFYGLTNLFIKMNYYENMRIQAGYPYQDLEPCKDFLFDDP